MRSISPNSWFVLLGVLCQYQWATTLSYTTGPEKPCTGNRSVWSTLEERCCKRKGGKPVWNQLYHNQMWEKEMYTKVFQFTGPKSNNAAGIKCIWNQVLEISLGTLSISTFLCTSHSFLAPGSIALFDSQMLGEWEMTIHVFCVYVFPIQYGNQTEPQVLYYKFKFPEIQCEQIWLTLCLNWSVDYYCVFCQLSVFPLLWEC